MEKQNDSDELRISLLMPETYNPLNKKSKIIMSAVIALMLVIYIYLYIIGKSQGLFVGFWSVYGIIGLYQIYTGKNFLTLFGDAYLKLNQEYIKYKKGILKKEQVFLWKDIKKVSLKAGYFLQETYKKEQIKISFNNMEYAKVQKVKSALEKILKEKNIEYN
ncbi:MAG: hypothetical protein L3J74_01545 [Bacteroidales bacterium]|nr:hypothetical protein [Bacteroidales bacterium]